MQIVRGNHLRQYITSIASSCIRTIRPTLHTATLRLWLSLYLLLVLTSCNLDQARPITRLQTDESLVVAWVESGNLVVWQQGAESPRRLASGGVVRPYISPDGERIAFTRGPNGRPETLWVVDVGGISESLLVGEGNPRIFRNGQSQVGDVVWFDETILYINTYSITGFGISFNDDLYRVNTRTREVALILPAREGGRIYVSPDRSQVATVSAGTYGRQDARIRVVDPLAIEGADNLLFYVGVASASESPFHPRLHWLDDGQSMLVAIPDANLIYSEIEAEANVPPTRLWQLPVNRPSDRNLLGSVRASFFGLPVWSDDASQMLYLRRIPQSNQFTVVLANANGDNPTDYITGDSGQIELPRWIPDSTRFIYNSETPGNMMMGERDADPQPLSRDLVFAPKFVDDSLYVFVTTVNTEADGFQLRFARIRHQSIPIAPIGDRIPLFDAVLVPSANTNN